MLALMCATVAWAGAADKDRRAVEKAFDAYRSTAEAYDPSLYELFAADAMLTNTRNGQEQQMSVAALKDAFPQLMEMARLRQDADSFTEISVQPHEAQGRWRVTAVRHNAATCTTDDAFRQDYVKVGRRWLIVTQHTTSTSKSLCPPDPQISARLDAVRAATAGLIPLQVDDETVMTAIEVDGNVIVYTMSLPNVAASDLAKLDEALQGVSLQAVCANGAAHDLLDDGATFRYRWQAGGEERIHELVNGDCP